MWSHSAWRLGAIDSHYRPRTTLGRRGFIHRLQTGDRREDGRDEAAVLPRIMVSSAALGPVFNSCSPTYALVVASVLPASFNDGTGYVVAHASGLSLALLILAVTG